MNEETARIWRDAVNAVCGHWLLSDVLRARLLRLWGIKIGEGARISSHCFFGDQKVSIGRYSYINQGAHFDSNGAISIGGFCTIGMQLLIATSDHKIGPPERRAGQITGLPVSIGDGCWLGGRVTIRPGVTIGTGCVIAAGAVVTKDCEPNGAYAGVPARRVRTLGP